MDTYRTPRHLARTLFTLVVGISTIVSGASSAQATPYTIEGLTPDQRALVDASIALYEEAGLELPPVRFTGSSNPEKCEGHSGLARDEGEFTHIIICTTQAGLPGEMLIIHELAHAWDFHSLTDEDRDAFQALRGTDSWLERDVEWYERGGEQAAEIMVWALIDRPISLVKIPNTGCHDLHAAYHTLTGAEPLHGYEDHC